MAVGTIKSNVKSYKDHKEFTKEAGIYAIISKVTNFPLASAQEDIQPGDIIYMKAVGNGMMDYEMKNNFEPGNTIQSELRRHLGAILERELKLDPVPTLVEEKSMVKYNHYKFSEKGEEKLSKWMKENLQIAILPTSVIGRDMIIELNHLIGEHAPLLNLENNAANAYRKEVQRLVNYCAGKAIKWYSPTGTPLASPKSTTANSLLENRNKSQLTDAIKLILKRNNGTTPFEYLQDELIKQKLHGIKMETEIPHTELEVFLSHHPGFELIEHTNMVKIV